MRSTGLATKLLVSACVAIVPTVAMTGMAWAQQAPTATTVLSPLPTPTPPPASPQDNCVKGTWPQTTQGRPLAFKAGDHGVYVWHDPDGGWALRATHAGPHDRVIFSGTLTTSGKFVDLTRVKDEANDIVAISPNHRTITFRFVNYGWVDGLNFATHCSTSFDVRIAIDAALAPTSLVHLGAAEVSPLTNPFDIARS